MTEKSKEDQQAGDEKFEDITWEFEPTENANHRLNLIFKLLLSNNLCK